MAPIGKPKFSNKTSPKPTKEDTNIKVTCGVVLSKSNKITIAIRPTKPTNAKKVSIKTSID
ncbi:hypothetical protein [Campylobacter sp.]|uniref:hypothetical protein n=1 Tax=Campylobacter sp. TaxID=205 RepID=UPI002A911F40|nr:hypothetical protein [Campylobacter sp.]